MSRSRSVLIVDNDPLVRRALRRLLAGAGFLPHEAASGEEVLAVLRGADAPAALILDLDLPDMRGEEVLRAVRSQGMGVAVVVHSGAIDDGQSDSLLSAGADECLAKPAAGDILVACLERLLDRRPRCDAAALAGAGES